MCCTIFNGTTAHIKGSFGHKYAAARKIRIAGAAIVDFTAGHRKSTATHIHTTAMCTDGKALNGAATDRQGTAGAFHIDCSAAPCYRTIALNDTFAHTILDFQRAAIRDVKRSLVICRCNGVAVQINAQFFGNIMGPVMGNISQISYGITACVGGLFCVAGRLSVGDLSVFVNYSRQLSRPINELSMQVNTIFSALAGAERVFKVMDEESEEEDAPNAVPMEEVKGEVILKNVTFGYNPDKVILKNIDLYAHAGQKVAFVGSTGAGKTTITNLLNRFYDIQEGSITIDGRDIKDYERTSLRSHIAMVLQDTHLFTGTVRENIRYGRPDATDEEVEQAAKTASAHSFIMRLEDGYDTMLEGDGINLSQGQRQLLNIARAAVSKAPILVLDEATSSVDTRTEMHIDHGMERLMKNRTTFVIAHRLSTVRNADCIMVLEQGEIIERGTHEQLLEMKGRYYQLYTGAVELD